MKESENKEKKEKNFMKTSIEVDRQKWAFIKSDAILRDKKTREIVDEAFRLYQEKRRRGEETT